MKKTIKKLIMPLVCLAVFIVPFVAFAQPVDPAGDVGGFFELLWEKLQSSEWLVAFGIGLIGLVELLKRGLPFVADLLKLPWLKRKLESKWGKIIMAAATALVLTVGTAFAAGQEFSFKLVGTALAAAWAASGGWENLNDLIALISGSDDEE